MTVSELMERLERMPKYANVTFYSEEAGGWANVDSISFENNNVVLPLDEAKKLLIEKRE